MKTINLYLFLQLLFFDYLDACNRFYNLSFRIVRFKIADDKYETLVTILDENEFGLSDFKDLYHLRWNEELHSIISNMQLVCFISL